MKKKINKSRRKLLFFLLNFFTNFIKLDNNLIIMESFFGRSVNDNPLAIYHYLKDSDFNIIFSVNNPRDFPDMKVVKRKSIKYYFYLRKAKFIVTNQRMIRYWKKKPNQIYIQTWHGTPLKKLVHDLDTFNMPSANSLESYYKLFDNDIKNWDYLLSSCEYATKCFKSAFQYEKEILEIGYPRNEKMYNYNFDDIEKIKEELNIPRDKKIILYAPTYRDDQNRGTGKYYYNSTLDFEKIHQNFPDHLILIRYHYIITETTDTNYDFVIDVSNYSDISNLYLISDLLITDYSSVFFDYSILEKPFLLYTDDIEKYSNALRGFYLDIYNEFPVKPALTTDEIIKQIGEIDRYDFKTFAQKYNPIKNINCRKEIIKIFTENK